MKNGFILSMVFLSACSGPSTRLKVRFVEKNNSFIISGIDSNFLAGIRNDTAAALWQSLIPIYCMPADTDLKDYQRPQPGRYKLLGNDVIFTPDTPFRRNQTYFVRYYRFGKSKSLWDVLKGKDDIKSTRYTEQVFRP